MFVSLLAHPSMCFASGRSEVDYIEDITHVILMRFSQKLLHVDKKLIGMDYHLQMEKKNSTDDRPVIK